jgi:uncharacterized YigZ family protein
MTSYQSVREASTFQPEPVKGSRFIARVYPVGTEDEANEIIMGLRLEYPDATHHCWAWNLHERGGSRSSDDGEPGGSAGRPILAQIIGHCLSNVLVVVTRYYGGTKLGVGGLIRAYGGAAGQALDRAEYCTHHLRQQLAVVHEYGDTKAVQAALAGAPVEIVETRYSDLVAIDLLVRVDGVNELRSALVDHTSGRVTLREPEPDSGP